jgi:hypothetical protein
MEQKDYMLREIEKVGKMLSAVRHKLFGGKESLAIISEAERIELNEMLLEEINFDLEKFLNLNLDESIEYLNSFEGFNTENIESLAELISQIGFADRTEQSKKILGKALQLYELVILQSKTFSFDREMKIQMIKNAL